MNTYENFLDALLQQESSGIVDSINTLGFLGHYQMGEAALVDAGYIVNDGNVYDNSRGKSGCMAILSH